MTGDGWIHAHIIRGIVLARPRWKACKRLTQLTADTKIHQAIYLILSCSELHIRRIAHLLVQGVDLGSMHSASLSLSYLDCKLDWVNTSLSHYQIGCSDGCTIVSSAMLYLGLFQNHRDRLSGELHICPSRIAYIRSPREDQDCASGCSAASALHIDVPIDFGARGGRQWGLSSPCSKRQPRDSVDVSWLSTSYCLYIKAVGKSILCIRPTRGWVGTRVVY